MQSECDDPRTAASSLSLAVTLVQLFADKTEARVLIELSQQMIFRELDLQDGSSRTTLLNGRGASS